MTARALQTWGARFVLGALVVLLTRVGPASVSDATADVALHFTLFAFLFVWAWHLCQQSGERLRDLVGRPPADRREWRWVGLVVPLGIVSVVGVMNVYYLLSWLAPGFVERDLLGPDDPPLANATAVHTMLVLTVSVVLGPVAEELFFRGALLRRWSARWGPWGGLVASSALFGVAHGPDLIGATAFGVFMALLYRRTGTLLVPMACHVANNALGAILEIIPDGADGEFTTLAEFRADAWPAAVALPLLVIGLVLGARHLHKLGPQPPSRVVVGS
jgi:uncharacterized protein